jgi:adenylate kinase family enzyme
MDRSFFWLSGWVLRERSTIRQTVSQAVAGERWIMDGTGPATLDLRLPRTDVVLWLRMPRIACIVGVLWRWVRYWRQSRPEMADGCPERLDVEFLRYIWNFERVQTPEIEEKLMKYAPAVPVFEFTSRSDMRALVQQISRRP